MTTQVVLMNGLGIALASDSAVTSGGKVLNTSEKVFELRPPHKVAVLASGRADFMGHPWEVLLSAWSETLERPLNSMPDYRESLYRFLRTILPSNADLVRPEMNYISDSYFGDGGVMDTAHEILSQILTPFFRDLLKDEDFEKFMENDAWDPEFRARISKLLTKAVLSEVEKAFLEAGESRKQRFEPAENVSYAQSLIWIDKYWVGVERSPSDDFPAWPAIPRFDELIKNLSSVWLVHADYRGESNINFVGYGANDLFPSGAGVYFHGVIAGTLIKRFEGALAPTSSPDYLFFGQSEAIRALTSGDDYLLTSTAVTKTRKTLNDIFEQLSESTDERAKVAREYVQQSIEQDDLADEMRKAGNEKRLKPFTRAIGMSPILDLAEFAAQLVGVQAASAAMTQENPSVGGFVDVATITHRRGFEWIRHKH